MSSILPPGYLLQAECAGYRGLLLHCPGRVRSGRGGGGQDEGRVGGGGQQLRRGGGGGGGGPAPGPRGGTAGRVVTCNTVNMATYVF